MKFFYCLETVVSTEELPGSYSYAEKICMDQAELCSGSWQFEKVFHKSLNYTEGEHLILNAESSIDCYKKCVSSKEFKCRSAVWIQKEQTCTISVHNRATLSGIAVLTSDTGI